MRSSPGEKERLRVLIKSKLLDVTLWKFIGDKVVKEVEVYSNKRSVVGVILRAAIEESNYMSRTSIYNKVEELNIQELEFEI